MANESFRIDGANKDSKDLKSPILMDMIKFKNWNNEKLLIECDELEKPPYRSTLRHYPTHRGFTHWQLSRRTIFTVKGIHISYPIMGAQSSPLNPNYD